MKNVVLFIFTILFGLFCNAQQINGYVNLDQTTDFYLGSTETNFDVGINKPLKRGSFNFFVSYQYGGNLKYQETPMYKMTYHLLGGGLKYRILNKSKIYSPTIRITALTEIYSNYRGNHLSFGRYGDFIFFPSNEITPHFNISHNKGEPDKLLYYQTYDYISTPLVGSIFLGNEFRIFEGFNINVELGYLFRAVRAYHKKWEPNAPEPKTEIVETHRIKNSANGETEFIHYFEFGIGINYTFPFHKEKPQP